MNVTGLDEIKKADGWSIGYEVDLIFILILNLFEVLKALSLEINKHVFVYVFGIWCLSLIN